MTIRQSIQNTIDSRPSIDDIALGNLQNPKTLADRLAELDLWLNRALGQIEAVLGARTLRELPAERFSPVDPGWRIRRVERISLRNPGNKLRIAAGFASLDAAKLNARTYKWKEAFIYSEATVALGGMETERAAEIAELHARAKYMVEGNTLELRAWLEKMIADGVDSPKLRSFLARTSIVVGEYAHALEILGTSVGRLDTEGRRLLTIVSPQTGTPVDKFPSNYYTYRHQLLSDDQRAELDTELESTNEFARRILLPLRDLDAYWHEAINFWELDQPLIALNYLYDALNVAPDIFQWPDYNSNIHINLDELMVGGKWISEYAREHYLERRIIITLEELESFDWRELWTVSQGTPTGAGHWTLLVGTIAESDLVDDESQFYNFPARIMPLITQYNIIIPLAIAEVCCAAGRLEEALEYVTRVLSLDDTWQVLSSVIERPYALMLKARILNEVGTVQYRMRNRIDARLSYCAAVDVLSLQWDYEILIQQILQNQSQAIAEVNTPEDAGMIDIAYHYTVLSLQHHLSRVIGAIEKFEARQPLKKVRTKQASLLSFIPPLDYIPDGRLPYRDNNLIRSEPITDSIRINPQAFDLMLTAHAQICQIDADLNFYGYKNYYVPKWRFLYLLERARYFVGQVRRLQENYLNIIASADKEKLSETQIENEVRMSMASVAIEEASCELALQEQEAAKAAHQLAELVADNAQERYKNFDSHEAQMAALSEILGGAVQGGTTGASLGGSKGGLYGAIIGAVVGGGLSAIGISCQRRLERENLKMMEEEAKAGAMVTAQQQITAEAATNVALLKHLAAVMRYEFARQTYALTQNKVVTSRLLYKLSANLGNLAKDYLDLAQEFAFLAERAYEFEMDDRLGTIRFDYGLAELGDFLAGEFLMRDLDTLEHLYITNTKERKQSVRFVVSLARDFPDVLQQLRGYGTAVLGLNLRVIEQRFPGLYNCRITSADIQTFALMDSTRFAMQLSHLGSGVLRTAILPSIDDNLDLPISWCPTADNTYPITVQVVEPQTEVFTGMSRQEALGEIPDQANQQRMGFEGVAAATSWLIDMSMHENRINPDTLMDVQLVFNLAGYHSDELKDVILQNLPRESTQTLSLSSQTYYGDALYHFHQTGVMNFPVTSDVVPTGMSAGRLRNLGVQLIPRADSPQFGKIIGRQQIELLDTSGFLTITHPVINIQSFDIDKQVVSIKYFAHCPVVAKLNYVECDWGDTYGDRNDGPITSDTFVHTYARPGVYAVTLRVVYNGRLRDFTYRVAVSSAKTLAPPVHTFIKLIPTANGWALPHTSLTDTVIYAVDLKEVISDDVYVLYWLDDVYGTSNDSKFEITIPKPSHGSTRVLNLMYMHKLRGRLWSKQRYTARNNLITFEGLTLTTNREFDDAGQLLSNASSNILTQQLFPGDTVLSPLDTWQMELTTAENPFLESVTSSGKSVIDLSEIQDIVLSLEYDAFVNTWG